MRPEGSEPILPVLDLPRTRAFYESLSCYWRVADADRLYHEFAALGLPASGLPRITEPQDEPWGMREFTLKDPSGNLLRVGHELPPW